MNADETAKNLRRFSELLNDRQVGDYEKRMLARTLKVTEEAGELSAAVIRWAQMNILKEDGEPTPQEIRLHIMSLAVTVLALYEMWDGHGERVLDHLEMRIAKTLEWAKEQTDGLPPAGMP